MAARENVPVLFITANVGSIFEEPALMLKQWTLEFLTTVTTLQPLFIALHCQEVGGKNYEHSMKHVEDFVRLLMASNELRAFDKVRVFLDEDFTSAEKFTALGNFYFIHESISDIQIWDFKSQEYVDVTGKEVHSGNIEDVTTKEKSKFPQDFFPECKWSRKGFLRTRWRIKGTEFDLINIHLFHDASNFMAMEAFPSMYSNNRRRALQYALDRFHSDEYDNLPFFIFGDFNFRVDTHGVIKKLTKGLVPLQIQCNKSGEKSKLQYRDDSSQVILSIGTKEFNHQEHQKLFYHEMEWLKEFDRELEPFRNRVFEFAIKFPPSYPFEEELKASQSYMTTRCPAWCDRIIISHAAKCLVSNPSNDVTYSIMGPNVCMGDHKPVYLRFDLALEAGIIHCCNPEPTSSYHTISRSPDPAQPTALPPEPCHVDGEWCLCRQLLGGDVEPESMNPHASSHSAVKRHVSESGWAFKGGTKCQPACRCLSDLGASSAVMAAVAIARAGAFPPRARIRLISTSSDAAVIGRGGSHRSLRHQSHHSSSEEDWFEEVPEDEEGAKPTPKRETGRLSLEGRQEPPKKKSHDKKQCCVVL